MPCPAPHIAPAIMANGGMHSHHILLINATSVPVFAKMKPKDRMRDPELTLVKVNYRIFLRITLVV